MWFNIAKSGGYVCFIKLIIKENLYFRTAIV